MYLTRLDLYGLRNLQRARLDCNPQTNIIYGQNGSGKTSLLEGLSLLSRARSFRQRDTKAIINHESEQLVVSARCKRHHGNASQPTASLGIQRSHTATLQARHNGESVSSAMELSALLPLQIIEPQSFQLLEGGPLQRRQFIDWGVFHVEQAYRGHWLAYQRGLKQRNELLRRGRITSDLLAPWSSSIAAHGEAISGFRQAYLQALTPYVRRQLASFGALDGVELQYQSGWSVEHGTLLQALEASEQRDIKRGLTHCGPHRAELKVTVSGHSAAEVMSRGEVKLLVYALKLAQAQYYAAHHGEPCVLAIDDLPAELDYRHRGQVLAAVVALQGQSFITGVDRGDFSPFGVEIGEASLFHVEQGEVSAADGFGGSATI